MSPQHRSVPAAGSYLKSSVFIGRHVVLSHRVPGPLNVPDSKFKTQATKNNNTRDEREFHLVFGLHNKDEKGLEAGGSRTSALSLVSEYICISQHIIVRRFARGIC
jgi:hypothetical protein